MNKIINKIDLGKAIWGVPDGANMLAISDLLSRGEKLVFVARDDSRMMAMRDAISRLNPDASVRLLPAWDCLPFDRLSPQGALVGQRVETLAWLSEEVSPLQSGGSLLLTTVNALLQRVPPKAYFAERSVNLKVGDTTGPARLSEFLAGQGYLRTDTVRETGEFALRGGILDVFPPGQENPVRLDFLGMSLKPSAALMPPHNGVVISWSF